MAEHVKVYEEKKGMPVWAWLIPLLLLLALLAYFLLHRQSQPATAAAPAPEASAAAPVASTTAYPDLGTVHFETDKADLTDQDKGALDKAAEAMKDHPDVHLRLEGYTDSTGTDTHNLTLAQQRTYAVADYLKSKGVDGSRLTGDGFASNNPVSTNSTESGKADNRRVELFTNK